MIYTIIPENPVNYTLFLKINYTIIPLIIPLTIYYSMVYWVFLFSGKPSGEIPWFGKPQKPRTEKNVQQKTTKSTALPAVAA
jgi:hypothetical protein